MKKILLLIILVLSLLPIGSVSAAPAATTTGTGATAEPCSPYPQCLFNIHGDEHLLPSTSPSYLPDIRFTDPNAPISGKDLVKLITRFILGFIGAVSLLILVIGGFMYITAQGDEGQVEKAKKAIIGAVIGIIIVLAAWTIVITVLNITDRRGGNQFLPGDNTNQGTGASTTTSTTPSSGDFKISNDVIKRAKR